MRSKLGMRVAFAATALLSAGDRGQSGLVGRCRRALQGRDHPRRIGEHATVELRQGRARARLHQGDRASTSSSRPRPGTRCTTRRSRTWRPTPASMTSSISSRTSSTAISAATSSSTSPSRSTTTRSSKSPDFDRANFTSFIDYFKDPKNDDLFGVPMEAFVKVYLYRKDLFEDPKVQAAFKAKYGHDLAPAKTHKEYQEIAEFFTDWGKENGQELWGTTVQAHPAIPHPGTSSSKASRPTFGVYNWGIDADKNYAASVANGGEMNGPEAKAALTAGSALLKYAPPESTAEHLGRGRGHLRRRPRRAGPGLRRERRLDRDRRQEVQGRRQGRRGAAAGRARRDGSRGSRRGLYRLL